MIGILNLNFGNTGSIESFLKRNGYEYLTVNNKRDLQKCSKLIFPGMGTFKGAMDALHESGITKSLKKRLEDGSLKYLGICIGMHVLFNKSEESPESMGLAVLKGNIKKLSVGDYPVPHIGWNEVESLSMDMNMISDNPIFYFAHSYVACPTEKIATTGCYHNEYFISSIRNENIFGVQFHPEKSGKSGENILNYFLAK